MAISLTSSLSLSPLSPLLFKPNSFSSPNSLLFPKNPFITITNSKTKRIESINTITSIEEEEEDEDEVEDGDEEFLAFEEMRRWEMTKPSGFGEGKVYDTTMEERILEELEEERMAKITAEKKKKVEESLSKKKEQHEKKEFITSGPTVRLANLPKKRNIHRDLQTAFKAFDGIVNITPVVSGNWKTRDPICKGLAFVELVSEKAANRFVNTYSKQAILFGKVQKQISFEYINPEQSVNDQEEFAQPNFTNYRNEISHKEFFGGPTINETEAIETGVEDVKTSYLSEDNQNESHGDELNQKQMPSRNNVVKKKSAKTAKLSLPSSMARLKIKERTVLTGVFSKYGGKVASGSD